MNILKNRPNKIAKGCTWTDARRKDKRPLVCITEHQEDMMRLSYRGTLDELAMGKMKHYIKKVKVKHPTDFGYYKEAYVLNDAGKLKYKRLKRKLKRYEL